MTDAKHEAWSLSVAAIAICLAFFGAVHSCNSTIEECYHCSGVTGGFKANHAESTCDTCIRLKECGFND